MSEALEALEDVITYVWLRGGMNHLGPGKVIENLSPEKREVLKTLTSKDVDIILDSVFKIGLK